MQRRLHYAEIEEKRINKYHTEVALFAEHEEKDKGMCALRQLEFMKEKIDTINKGLRINLEVRKKDTLIIEGLNKKIDHSDIILKSLPEYPEHPAEVENKA